MTTATRLDDQVIEAAGQAAIYSLLATGLAFPTTHSLYLLEHTLIPVALKLDAPGPFGEMMEDLSRHLPESVGQARDDHMALFPPITSQDAPGYETAYRGDDIFQQSTILADIAGFYRAHGLRAGGRERERLDHITVELEFMAVLARKQVLSLQNENVDNNAVCRNTASLFVRDHLGCWAPAFGRRAAAITTSPWYQRLGLLMAVWVETDMTHAGITPVEVVEEPLPQEPPDDGMCGPCPVPGGGPTG